MYGSGRGVIKGILQGTGCEVQEIRAELNPGFGGVHPEPISRYLGALASAISMGMGDLGLVTDGDADRIGAMDGRGNFVDPHKIMALSLRYLVEKRGWRGPVIRTVSTTSMIDRLAKRYDLPMYETPVGFNHIADYMLKGDVLIGGEESGGISFHGHIPEGDGIIMGTLIAGDCCRLRCDAVRAGRRLAERGGTSLLSAHRPAFEPPGVETSHEQDFGRGSTH